jgi:hypothetical protein
VAEVRVTVDLVAVPAAFLDPHQKALGNEVGDDLLGGVGDDHGHDSVGHA